MPRRSGARICCSLPHKAPKALMRARECTNRKMQCSRTLAPYSLASPECRSQHVVPGAAHLKYTNLRLKYRARSNSDLIRRTVVWQRDPCQQTAARKLFIPNGEDQGGNANAMPDLRCDAGGGHTCGTLVDPKRMVTAGLGAVCVAVSAVAARSPAGDLCAEQPETPSAVSHTSPTSGLHRRTLGVAATRWRPSQAASPGRGASGHIHRHKHPCWAASLSAIRNDESPP